MSVRHAARRLAVLGTIAVVLVPIAACSDDGPEEGEADLRLSGTARIERQDGDRETLRDDDTVRVGDQITLTEGTGQLRLPDGTVLELRAGRGEAEDSALVMGPKPVLEGGDLLVITDDEIEIDAAGTDVVVEAGAARVTRRVGMTAASYSAAVHIDSAEQERDVPPLRQIQVATLGEPPVQASPLVFSSSDPWDRRFLGDAIDLGVRLEAVSNGFSQTLRPGTGGTAAFLRSVLPGLLGEPEFEDRLLVADRPAGETLIGAAIADLGQRGSFAERWASVFAFRDAGAAWGLVALDQGVEAAPLIAAVTAAVEVAPLDTATTGSPPNGPTVPPVGPPPAPTPQGSPTTTVPPTTTTTTPLPTPGEDEPGLLTPILDPLLEPVTDVLNSLVGGLLGGLLGR